VCRTRGVKLIKTGDVVRSALQTNLQGVTGTMLKSADYAHVQQLPSLCDVFR
jgi:hypothetical protein